MSLIKGKHKAISITAGQFIPEGVKDIALELEVLLKAYYEWSEQTGEFQKESKVLADSFSYHTADDNYLLAFKDILLRQFPDNTTAVMRHLLKFSKTFYTERGTTESYEFLFNALWGAEVKISYPSEYIMKSSDGIWIERTLMKIDTTTFKGSLIGKTLLGKKSGARALISEVNKVFGDTSELVLESISNDFIPDETIEIYNDNMLLDLIGISRIVSSLGAYNIIDPGLGYRGGAKLSILNAGDGKEFDAEIYAADNTNGKIISLSILNAGYDYVYTKPTLELADKYLFDSRKTVKRTAVIELIPTANYKEPGQYLKPKSLLSDIYKLHDGYYYQEFSYVIETKLNFDVIFKPVNELLHPAGLKMFYKKLYNNTGNVVELDTDMRAITGEYIKKEPSAVIYSGGLEYSGPLSIYQ